MEYVDRTFDGEVELDGNSFIRCHFDGATLIYGGGRHPTLDSCKVSRCSVQLVGSAARTMAWLRGMVGTPLGVVTSAAINDIFKQTDNMAAKAR